MGDVIDFKGITKLDLDPERVLEKAKGRLESVVIMGYDKDGHEYFESSISNGPEVNWLIDSLKARLLAVEPEDE